MCGIAGVLGEKLEIDKINFCLNHLKERGPDGNGFYRKEKITLIHTRLSVLDLSSEGSQPMIDERTGLVIIYNGEIYNFNDLQKKYLNSNYKNDTRVILNLFIKFGIKTFSLLRGMFAIAIWNPKSQELIIARDRFGIKPIYYSNQNNNFYFGSDVRALEAIGVKKKISERSIKYYLVDGILEDNENTLYEGIRPLKPGKIIRIKNSKLNIIDFWKANKVNKIKIKKKEVQEALDEKLLEVIKMHLISDVKVGLTLSSGIDSQILIKYMLKLHKDVSAYTYGYENKIYDESTYVKNKYISENVKILKNILKPNDFLSELKDAIEYFQSPIGGLGTLSLFSLMKLIKKDKTKVILSGEGGDEIFYGYKYYYYAYLLKLKKKNKVDLLNKELELWKKTANEDLSNFVKNINELKINIYGSQAPDGTSLSSIPIAGEFFNDLKIKNYKHFKKISSDDLKNINLIDITAKKLPKLLMFQDRSSMKSSIESRVPFLDNELYEFSRNIEISNHIGNGTLKNLLRKNLYNDYNSNEKKYVATPQREWFKAELYEKIKEILFDGYLVNNKIINKELFFKEYKKYKEDENLGNSFFVWKVLNLELLQNL